VGGDQGQALLRNSWQRYGVAAALAGLAVGVRLLLGEAVRGLPFVALFPAVVLATLLGGTGPGLLAIFVGGLAAWYLLIPPFGVFFPIVWPDLAGLVLYVLAALACLWLARRVQRASEANFRLAEERKALLAELDGTLRQLAVSEARHRAIGETIDYGIWITDGEGMLLHCSQSFLDLVGMTPEEARNLGWTRALHPDDRAMTETAWRRCRNTGEAFDREHRYRGVDGHFHPVLARGRALRDASGKIVSWVGFNLDIAEIKRTEQALRDATRAKNRLLAAAGHDLKQPLQVILSALDRVGPAVSDPAAAAHLRRAERAVERLDSALDSLLAASRLELGGVQPVIESFPIRRILAMLGDIHGEAAEAKGLRLTLLDCSLAVRTDPDLLMTILGNLIGNAVKYTERGGILIGCRRRGALLSVEVVDTGMGIPEALVERIFEEFQQVDRRHDGFGLGLSIVKRTADLLGLRVKVYSTVGRGSRFTVEVPVALP
jgi:PAS domain S-box-containing protein